MSVTAMPQAPTEAVAEEPKGGKKKKLVVVAVVLLLAAGGWFFLKPGGGDAAPKPGEVVTLEPIQLNLAAGHYLRIGIALQLVEGAKEVDGSKALDATIAEFSGATTTEVNQPARREALKKALLKELDHRYDGDVMGVYFTEFVTQ